MKKAALWLLGVLAFIYVFGMVMFGGRFMFRTYVRDVDGNMESVAFKTAYEAASDMMRRTGVGTVSFLLQDGSRETARFSDLGIYNSYEMEFMAEKPNMFAWPLSLFKPVVYDIGYELAFDENALKSGLGNMQFVKDGIIPPKDAYVAQTEDGSFEIVPEELGTQIDLDAAVAAVKKRVLDGSMEVNLYLDGCYKRAEVDAGDASLLTFRDAANSYLDAEITLDFGAGLVQTLTRDQINSLSVMTSTGMAPSRGRIEDYVAQLAEQYDWYGKERTFHTSTDVDISISPVGTGPCDFTGWELDQEAFADLLAEALSSGRNAGLTVPWIHKGAGHGEQNDIGDTYLEISLDEQHMWLYQDGALVVDTDVVTGMRDDPERATPRGLWRTTDMYTEHTMTGSYGTAFCHYFIRVTLDGVGVHDASWRGAFGGSIYTYDGSHGCINTPYKAEKIIFETLKSRDTWTPIIIW